MSDTPIHDALLREFTGQPRDDHGRFARRLRVVPAEPAAKWTPPRPPQVMPCAGQPRDDTEPASGRTPPRSEGMDR